MSLIRFLDNYSYFDSIFDEAEREFARMEQDMRCAMNRIAPRDYLSLGSKQLTDEVDKLRNPIVEEDGKKELCLKYDVAGFKPEEISVKTADGAVQVEATHKEESDNSKVYRHFSRSYKLPEGVDPDKLTSSLSKDGVLFIKGPADTPAITQK